MKPQWKAVLATLMRVPTLALAPSLNMAIASSEINNCHSSADLTSLKQARESLFALFLLFLAIVAIQRISTTLGQEHSMASILNILMLLQIELEMVSKSITLRCA